MGMSKLQTMTQHKAHTTAPVAQIARPAAKGRPKGEWRKQAARQNKAAPPVEGLLQVQQQWRLCRRSLGSLAMHLR